MRIRQPARRTPRTRWATLALAAVLVASASAQESPENPPGSQAQSNQPVSLAQALAAASRAEPIRRAGLRASILAQSSAVVPLVAVVDSGRGFLDTIERWEWPLRFPILIDDGSPSAREDIARFVRAFEPETVVRVGSDPDAPSWGSMDRAARKSAIDRALSRSVRESDEPWDAVLGALRGSGVVSPGVVALDPEDPQWAGGLALAAGRIQPVIFTSGDHPRRGSMSRERAAALERTIEAGVARSGLDWRTIGDDIDAVTLAMTLPVRTRAGDDRGDQAATTDRIGRAGDPGIRETGVLWARSGQLVGGEARSVYQAMCALFLEIDSAWIWDGYEPGGEWDRFDGTDAGETLRTMGLGVEVHDTPRNALRHFEIAAATGPIDAALVLMNSKGNADAFQLPGANEADGAPGDLPMLVRPAAMHMVHSYSLNEPTSPRTVGGRWLDRGVYLYAGSVHEPYLTGFVPTPDVARRLLGGLPLAAAARYDGAPMWKIALIGDPLKTLGPPGRRVALDAYDHGVEGTDLRERAARRLKDGDFGGAIDDLATLGDDEALGRLAAALIKDRPDALTPDAALAAIHGAFRSGRHGLVLDLFERLDDDGREDQAALDTLWLAGRYLVARRDDDRALALLRRHLRKGQRVRDAEELAFALRRDSPGAAVALLEGLRGDLSRREERRLKHALERIRR